ncbi:cytochrome c oxidase assembly protein CtaG/Cox11 [Colletotrichum sojae]|uniref:Cytochrome c oxidase assembly protein CtaG/Cox11 n=1 Tax=Colletotrichum sojae TaxID=2175907 RepID=A0A8H6MVB3_9PEZI|nr:cytochrome c oxidase assembly protein CtaG/Cox11 [Colletotrichum sojae]
MNALPRLPWRLPAQTVQKWSCFFCQHARLSSPSLRTPAARRAASTTPTPKQTGPSFGGAPSMEEICATTGWGGQPVRAHGPDVDYSEDGLASRLVPVTSSPRIRVTFSSSVSDVLPWKFTPQQREVRVLPGETALAFYTATNNSDQDIIGVATYSVTPGQVAPYFSKIQCFCFEEQRLNAGETVDMPVFFYLDPDIVNDVNMRGIETVTLNYTFFKAKYDDNGKFKAPVPFRESL